jgi:predicted DNA-binding protein
MQKIKKESQLAVRLEPQEKELLNYFATRMGISPSALVRNQIKFLLKDLEEKLTDKYYANMADRTLITEPKFTQEEIEEIFQTRQ